MNTSIIIFLFIMITSYYFYTKYATVKKPTDLTIDNTSHIPNIPSQACGVLNPLTIVNCTNDNQCNQCKCSDDSSLSGCMTCQIIDNNNTNADFTTFYSDIDQSNCTFPYKWDDENNICKLTNGQYCLPTIMQDVYCNPYTSKKILEKTNIGYQWKCICNNTDTFNQTPNSGQDCNHMMLCGMEGSTINPRIRGIYRLTQDGVPFQCNRDDDCSSGDKCVEGKCFWQPGSPTTPGSEWDPNGFYQNSKNRQAACKCGPEEIAGPNMTCIPNKCPGGVQACIDSGGNTVTRDSSNNCPPNSTPSENSCACPPNRYIDCGDIGMSQTTETGGYYYNGICTEPSCVPDPCGPNGTLDISSKNCVCNVGYTNVIASHTLIGQTCINLCDDDHNPCGANDENSGMKRGDCFVDSVKPTEFTINADSISGSNQPTMTLSFLDKNNVTCYLQINSDSTIGVSRNKTTANLFTLVPYCDPTLQQNNTICPTSTSTVTLNDSYYVTFKPSSNSTVYLDFINKKAVPIQPNLMGDISSFPDKSTEWPTLIKLIKLDANFKDIKTGISAKKVYRNTTIIKCYLYVPRFKIYISTTSSNDLTTKTVYNSAKCGRADPSGVISTSPLVCKDGFEIGGKNRDKCVNRDRCKPGYIQDGDFLCNQTPGCSSKFKFGSSWQCKLLTNNCGPDYYPTCSLGGTTFDRECTSSCQPRQGYSEDQLRNFSIDNSNNPKDSNGNGMERWCPDY